MTSVHYGSVTRITGLPALDRMDVRAHPELRSRLEDAIGARR